MVFILFYFFIVFDIEEEYVFFLRDSSFSFNVEAGSISLWQWRTTVFGGESNMVMGIRM